MEKEWTDEEIEQLKKMYLEERKPYTKIAEVLDRPWEKIRSKVISLGIQRHEMQYLNYRAGDIFGCCILQNIEKVEKRWIATVECKYCHKIKKIRASDLTNSKFTSCGCRINNYGMGDSRIYHTWSNMKYRCYNPNHHEWENYGGKNIKVCDEWLGEDGFKNFYEWAMKNGYSDDLTIDRIDSSKDYTPENCQWITRGENTAKSNKICQHRRANKGRYYGISPDGTRYEFDNANEFGREHNLNPQRIRRVCNQVKVHTLKGWTFGYVNEEAA